MVFHMPIADGWTKVLGQFRKDLANSRIPSPTPYKIMLILSTLLGGGGYGERIAGI